MFSTIQNHIVSKSQTKTSLPQIFAVPAANLPPIQLGEIKCHTGYGGYNNKELDCTQSFKNKTQFQFKTPLVCRVLVEGHIRSTEGYGVGSGYISSGATDITLDFEDDTITFNQTAMPTESYKVISDEGGIIQAAAENPNGGKLFLSFSKIIGLGIRVYQYNWPEKVDPYYGDLETIPFQCQ